MGGKVFYNEIDPHAAEWLRQLIADGMIPDGDVDTRDIREIAPNELRGYVQVHLFAGVSGWAYALRLAGWPDNRPAWTASCPCQPFSAAGKRKGTADERHLWPAFRWLIEQCRPPTCFGEQVASKDGRLWLDGVRSDLETMGYAVGAADLCAAGIGSPHIRQRLFWVADTGCSRSGEGCERRPDGADTPKRSLQTADVERCRQAGGLGGTDLARPQGRQLPGGERAGERAPGAAMPWSDFELVYCRDGKVRRTQRGLFPLVDGIPLAVGQGGDIGEQEAQGTAEARVMRLRGYGNSIVPQLAAEFIRAYLESKGEQK